MSKFRFLPSDAMYMRTLRGELASVWWHRWLKGIMCPFIDLILGYRIAIFMRKIKLTIRWKRYICCRLLLFFFFLQGSTGVPLPFFFRFWRQTNINIQRSCQLFTKYAFQIRLQHVHKNAFCLWIKSRFSGAKVKKYVMQPEIQSFYFKLSWR